MCRERKHYACCAHYNTSSYILCCAPSDDKLAETCLNEIKNKILKEKEKIKRKADALGRQVSMVFQQQLR